MSKNAFNKESPELSDTPIGIAMKKTQSIPTESQSKIINLSPPISGKVEDPEPRESPPAHTVAFREQNLFCPKCSSPLIHEDLATHKKGRRYPITLFQPLSSLLDNESVVFLSDVSTQQDFDTLRSQAEPHLMTNGGTITNGIPKSACVSMQSILEQVVGNYCDSVCEPVNATTSMDFKNADNVKDNGEESTTNQNNDNEMQMVPPYCVRCKSYIVQEAGESEVQDETLNSLVVWLAASRSTDDGINESNLENESLRPSKGSITVALNTNKQHRQHEKIWSSAPEEDLFSNHEMHRLPPRPEQASKNSNKTANLTEWNVLEQSEQELDRYSTFESENSSSIRHQSLPVKKISQDAAAQSPSQKSLHAIDSSHSLQHRTALPRDPPASSEKNSMNTPMAASSVILTIPSEQNKALEIETACYSSPNEMDTSDHESVGTSYTLEEKKNIIDHYEQKRRMATKAIGRKLMEGYALTQTQCKSCEMPVMELLGKSSCVVCPLVTKKAKKRADLRRKGRAIRGTFTSDSESPMKQKQKITVKTEVSCQQKKNLVTTATFEEGSPAKTSVLLRERQLRDLTDFIVFENRDSGDGGVGGEKVDEQSNSYKSKQIEGISLHSPSTNDTTFNDSYLGTDSSTFGNPVLDAKGGTSKTFSDTDQESNMNEEVYRRLLRGWLITSVNCPECIVPMMKSPGEETIRCVLCAEEPKSDPPASTGDSNNGKNLNFDQLEVHINFDPVEKEERDTVQSSTRNSKPAKEDVKGRPNGNICHPDTIGLVPNMGSIERGNAGQNGEVISNREKRNSTSSGFQANSLLHDIDSAFVVSKKINDGSGFNQAQHMLHNLTEAEQVDFNQDFWEDEFSKSDQDENSCRSGSSITADDKMEPSSQPHSYDLMEVPPVEEAMSALNSKSDKELCYAEVFQPTASFGNNPNKDQDLGTKSRTSVLDSFPSNLQIDNRTRTALHNRDAFKESELVPSRSLEFPSEFSTQMSPAAAGYHMLDKSRKEIQYRKSSQNISNQRSNLGHFEVLTGMRGRETERRSRGEVMLMQPPNLNIPNEDNLSQEGLKDTEQLKFLERQRVHEDSPEIFVEPYATFKNGESPKEGTRRRYLAIPEDLDLDDHMAILSFLSLSKEKRIVEERNGSIASTRFSRPGERDDVPVSDYTYDTMQATNVGQSVTPKLESNVISEAQRAGSMDINSKHTTTSIFGSNPKQIVLNKEEDARFPERNNFDEKKFNQNSFSGQRSVWYEDSESEASSEDDSNLILSFDKPMVRAGESMEDSLLVFKNLETKETTPRTNIQGGSHFHVDNFARYENPVECRSCRNLLNKDPSSRNSFYCRNPRCNVFMIPLDKVEIFNSAMNEKIAKNSSPFKTKQMKSLGGASINAHLVKNYPDKNCSYSLGEKVGDERFLDANFFTFSCEDETGFLDSKLSNALGVKTEASEVEENLDLTSLINQLASATVSGENVLYDVR